LDHNVKSAAKSYEIPTKTGDVQAEIDQALHEKLTQLHKEKLDLASRLEGQKRPFFERLKTIFLKFRARRLVLYQLKGRSMSGRLEHLDFVLAKKITRKTEYAVGDIIIFKRLAHSDELIVHKVADTTTVDGKTEYITQGVNNPQPDPGSVPKSNIVAKVGLTDTELHQLISLLEQGAITVKEALGLAKEEIELTKLKELGSQFAERLTDFAEEKGIQGNDLKKLFETSAKTSLLDKFEQGKSEPRLSSYFNLLITLMMNGETVIQGNLDKFNQEAVNLIWDQMQEYLKADRIGLSDKIVKTQFEAIIYTLYAYNKLGMKGSNSKSYYSINDLSESVSQSRSLITSQFSEGRRTAQVGKLILNLQIILKSEHNPAVEIALEKCKNYYDIMAEMPATSEIGKLSHIIIESYIFKELALRGTKTSWEVETLEGKIMDMISESVDGGLSKESELHKLIKTNLELYNQPNVDPAAVWGAIQEIAVDFTLTDNAYFLTQENIGDPDKSPGKVYKKYQDENRMLFIVNFRKIMTSGKARTINEDIHEYIIGKDIKNKQNIIFISMDQFMDILELSPTTRNRIDRLIDLAALAEKGQSSLKNYELLEELAIKEEKYLDFIYQTFGIGWEKLSEFQNR